MKPHEHMWLAALFPLWLALLLLVKLLAGYP